MDFGRDAQQIGTYDVADLVDAIAALPTERWFSDGSRQQVFEAHRSTQAIKLIADGDFRHRDPTVHEDFRSFERWVTPLMAAATAFYSKTMRQQALIARHGPGYFVRVLLTRLPGGTEIPPHVDEGYSLKRAHRIHVPIITNQAAKFRVGGTRFHMAVGEMWEINNRRVHSVTNEGEEARVHLILDFVQPGETVFDAEGVLIA